jgi:hypothetical protein
MEKQPLRHYVPFLPAYILLTLEWFHIFSSRRDDTGRVPLPRAVVCFGILCWALFSLAQAVNREVLFKLPLALGDTPGLTDRAMFSLVLPLAVAAGAAVWVLRARLLRGVALFWALTAMVGLWAVRDVIHDGRFLLAPSYRSAEISRAIEKLVPPGASIAGDYAPFLAINTPLRTLYMSRSDNPPSELPLLRPDFLLFSNTTEMLEMPRLIEEIEGVKLMPPVYSSTYAGRDVVLYPLSYDDSPREASIP